MNPFDPPFNNMLHSSEASTVHSRGHSSPLHASGCMDFHHALQHSPNIVMSWMGGGESMSQCRCIQSPISCGQPVLVIFLLLSCGPSNISNSHHRAARSVCSVFQNASENRSQKGVIQASALAAGAAFICPDHHCFLMFSLFFPAFFFLPCCAFSFSLAFSSFTKSSQFSTNPNCCINSLFGVMHLSRSS